jgi:hypothetical protein
MGDPVRERLQQLRVQDGRRWLLQDGSRVRPGSLAVHVRVGRHAPAVLQAGRAPAPRHRPGKAPESPQQ